MAYQTGTVASAAALQSAIEAFATANGWSLTSGVLSKGASFIRLTTPDAATLKIEGCNDASFAGGALCPRWSRVHMAAWPATLTYHLHAHASPDLIWCAVNYGVTDWQHVAFGDLAKTGTWTGGNWFFASVCSDTRLNGHPEQVYMDSTSSGANRFTPGTTTMNAPALFWGQLAANWNFEQTRTSFIHCELDGNVWPAANASGTAPSFPAVADPVHRRIVSSTDDEMVLVPYWLGVLRPDGYWSDVGHFAHLRCARLDQLAPGDVVDVGSDRWAVYPWLRRDSAQPNGGDYSTGLWAVAVRYDGP